MQVYPRSSMDEKDPDKFKKPILQKWNFKRSRLYIEMVEDMLQQLNLEDCILTLEIDVWLFLPWNRFFIIR
jgi:hypothetical protein